MTWGDDWLKNGLPIFNGGKDRSLARKMLDRMGGPQGFTTSQQTLPDGSVVTVQTKGTMPPQVTFTRRTPSAVAKLLRGYVAEFTTSASTVLSFLLFRHPLGKNVSTTKYGGYSVAATPSESPNVIFCNSGDVILYSGSEDDASEARIQGVGISNCVPLFRRSPSTQEDPIGPGWGAFLMSSAGVQSVTKGSMQTDDLYSAEGDSFDSGWAPISAVEMHAGVVYGGDQNQGALNRLYVSLAGVVMQRTRRFGLSNNAPFFSLGDWSECQITQPALVPSGSPTIETVVGWDADEPAYDQDIFYTVVKSNQVPETYYGTYALANIYQTGPLNYANTTTERRRFSQLFPWSTSQVVGWYAGDVSVSITMSTGHNYRRDSSNGTARMTSPVNICASETSRLSPPPTGIAAAYPGFNGEWKGLSVGETYGIAFNGNAQTTEWNSPTECSASIESRTLCRISVDIRQHSTSFQAACKQSERGYMTLVGLQCAYVQNGGLPAWDAIEYAANFDPQYQYPDTQWVEQNTTGDVTFTASMTTRDFILYDRAANTYVYLRGDFSSSGLLDASQGASTVSLSLVIEHNGESSEKLIYSHTGGPFIIYTETSSLGLVYHPAPPPFDGFAPIFCCQGNFPYGAYSEASDTGDNTILVSMGLQIMLNDEDDPQGGAFTISPPHFKKIVSQYMNIASKADITSFMHNRVHEMNFSDGEFTGWANEIGGLGVDYANVYRT